MRLKLSGIDFEIKFLFIAMLAFASAVDNSANILLTVSASIIHECGHLISMITMGDKPQKVVFELGGINIIKPSKTFLSLKKEIIIALSGPLVNFITLFFSCIIFLLTENEKLLIFASVNLILMLFNLLPIKGLDGGRALFYFLCKRQNGEFSKKTVFVLSVIFIFLTFLWGGYIFLKSKYNFSLIIIAIFLTLSLISDKEC